MAERRRQSRFRIVGRALLVTGFGLLLVLIFVGASLEYLSRTDLQRELRLVEPLRVFSADGLLIGEFGAERRLPVALAAIPPPVVRAFLAAEDSRFYAHHGIDPRGLARAAWRYLRTGEPAQGGSTITMQLARNLLLTPEKTFERKLAEMLLALHLERTLTKDEILTLYLNRVFFGHRAYGVAAAAALYYDKPLAALTLAESAMLAAIPKAPSADNPVTHPGRARTRRDHILGRMAGLGYIDQAAYQHALAEPDRARLHQRPLELDAGYAAEMARRELFARFGEDAYRRGYRVTTTIDGRLQRAAQDQVREALLAYDRRHGYRGPETGPAAITGPGAETDRATLAALLAQTDDLPGLRIGLVLSAGAQRALVDLGNGERLTLGLPQVQWARPWRNANQLGAQPRRVDAVVRAGDLIRVRPDQHGGWELAQRPAVTAALLALAPRDGAIRALVGGYRFGADQFNRAADAWRQPGSAFKPFIYAAALAHGWTPASLILDAPIALPSGAGVRWSPDNSDHRTLGPIRLRQALAQSRNLAAIHLLKRLGVDDARTFAARFGFDQERLPRNLTLALGTGLVTLPQLAGAYAVFANGGFRVEPHLIARIEDGAGTNLFEADPPRACAQCWFDDQDPAATGRLAAPAAPLAPRVLEPWLAYQMHSLLQSVITDGTGRRALELHRSDLAGKTGTTNEVRDAWFCGYQRNLVTVAWMGFDDSAPLGRGETGGASALGLWIGFMGEALKDRPEARVAVPAGLVQVWVDSAQGRRTHPGDADAISEWMREDTLGSLAGPDPVSSSAPHEATVGVAPQIIDEIY